MQVNHLKSAITDYIRNVAFPVLNIEALDDTSCVVRLEDADVKFALDPRDESVSSVISLFDAPIDYRDDLDTHIVAKAFAEVNWYDQRGDGNKEAKIKTEVDNVISLIRAIRESSLSGRDLLYFTLGYNAAYTDFYASGDGSPPAR